MKIGHGFHVVVALLLGLASLPCYAKTVVFWQAGFPAAESPAPSEAGLRAGFAGAEFVDAAGLSSALGRSTTDLLVLPYGSAWPEAEWSAILAYLDRGGNLIVLGGKPFTRAAYEDASEWHLRTASVAQSLELFIHDYQETPGSSSEVTFAVNPDVFPQLAKFGWKRAFSPVVRLSVVDGDRTGGHTGYEDMDLTTLVWGEKQGHKLAAPVIELDHNTNRFVGGRWILVACEVDEDFFSDTKLLAALEEIALRKNDRFTFRPRLPLFVHGDAMEFRFKPSDPMAEQPHDDSLHVKVSDEDGKVLYDQTGAFPDVHRLTLPGSAEGGRGFRTVEATLIRNGKPVRIYRSGYWMRDWNYLLSGPKLTAGSDYFELDGKPLPVVGTTYMSSDVSRMFLIQPNAYVWDKDMAQIHGAGLNMIRTGLWATWKQLLTPAGQMSEEGLRTIEAFLMCARHNGLPVQFNLFAFYPDEFGGVNGYLDPAALQAESRYAESVVARFSDVPFLAWDLINEPSANSNLWRTLPDGDPFEQAAWRKWLAERYPDKAKLLHDWAEPSLGMGRDLQAEPTATLPEAGAQDPLALPKAGAFQADGVRSGFNPLKVYDYTLFTQDVFAGWVKKMRALIRNAGSPQLITVGQDEGGVAGRVSPAFYSPLIDFTANHTWWDYDAILWASLAAKFPGKPLLIQETGEQRRLTLDDHLRFSPEVEAAQLERKIAIAFTQGAGALEWVWNVNAYMANDNEIPIGAVRPDGTEKPEAGVLAGFAAFAAKSPQSFTKIVPPEVTMVTSQVELYSAMGALAWATQKKALRAMAYYDHTPLRMLPENRVDELCGGGVCPKLVILPSAQALTEKAWQGLLGYVEKGGTLLVTGPVNRDEHWMEVDRMEPLGVKAEVMPLAVRGSFLSVPDYRPLGRELSFPADVQQSLAEAMRFADVNTSFADISHGKGRILWAGEPVEFADGTDVAAALYAKALEAARVQAPFRDADAPLSHNVLAFPTMLESVDGRGLGAVLYSFSNESMDAQNVDIIDTLTSAHINFRMQSQRGAALLLDRQGRVLASYGGAAVR